MKQLVIFDLDGTLLNTIADLGTATNHALSVNGYPTHPITSYPMMVGNGVRRLIERALPSEDRTDATIDRLLGAFKEYYNAHLYDLTEPYTGIVSLLDGLQSRGVAIAVASNKYEAAVRRLIEHFFGDRQWAAVCGQTEGVPVKPDPSIVFRILGEHPTPKADVLYVGDSGVDIETARRACVESVGVTWGFRPQRELAAAYADHIISDPADLLGLL
ncbi:MAG: HAD family hydrolase [Bacteroidales bacterium]|nr:HAD family hydrolase [Bacteroidales bacterium]